MGGVSDKENNLELKVGLFICIGLAVILAMVLKFGLGGSEGFKKYYPLILDLPNANGLLKGSDVLLAGARIGFVATKPHLSSNLGTVRVLVNIDDTVRIPRDSTFKVDSSGLLGDKFVAILTPQGFDPDKFDPKDPKQAYVANDKILGTHAGDLMETVTPVVKKLSDELDQLQDATGKLKDGFLSEANIQNVQMTLANLKTTSDNFTEASKGIPPIIKNAQEAVNSAKQTMTTANAAAGDLRKVLDSAKTVMQKATQGDGLLAAMLTNRELTENFKALVINLREHGVLFYRDSNKGSDAPSPSPARGTKRR